MLGTGLGCGTHEARWGKSASSLTLSPVFQTGSLIDWLIGWPESSINLSVSASSSDRFPGVRDLNTSPHAYAASALGTEPSPHQLKKITEEPKELGGALLINIYYI